MPADFVIVKATEGTSYTSAYLAAQARGVLGSGKLLGLYHYARGNTVAHEVTNFLAAAGPYLGRAALFLDWEGYGNRLFGSGDDAGWIAEFCAEVRARTGVTPLVYASSSVAFSLGVDDAHLWVAQYAGGSPVYGYEASPWNEGSYSCAIRQYASTGRLDGYGGDLDLDRFYGSRADWLALCEGATITYLTEDRMEFICNYNKEGRMVWFDGSRLHWLDEPDTMDVAVSGDPSRPSTSLLLDSASRAFGRTNGSFGCLMSESGLSGRMPSETACPIAALRSLWAFLTVDADRFPSESIEVSHSRHLAAVMPATVSSARSSRTWVQLMRYPFIVEASTACDFSRPSMYDFTHSERSLSAFGDSSSLAAAASSFARHVISAAFASVLLAASRACSIECHPSSSRHFMTPYHRSTVFARPLPPRTVLFLERTNADVYFMSRS